MEVRAAHTHVCPCVYETIHERVIDGCKPNVVGMGTSRVYVLVLMILDVDPVLLFNLPELTFSGPRVGPFGSTYCITLSIPCHLLDSRGEYP